MQKLISEQLPSDGGYHVKRLVNEANGRLKQIGKQGKRATIVAKKTSLTLQFTFNDGDGRTQKNVGLGAISSSAKGVQEAERIAEMVTYQLAAGTFNWDWFNALIGKDTSGKTQVLTCKEMVEKFKQHFFKQREGNKTSEKSWYERNREIEKLFSNLDKPLSSALIREVIESTGNNTDRRKRVIQGLVEFLKYFDNSDYKKVIQEYKKNNNPKRQKRNVPSDKRITEVYETGFIPRPRVNHGYKYRYTQWQFLFGLLATYGLRIHEAWNIANWDKPVTLKDGDWVVIENSEDEGTMQQYSGGDTVVPAILDPANEVHILCIKHDTKTGYRMAAPISPGGHNWIEEFNLLQPLNLPDVKKPLRRTCKNTGCFACTKATTNWFYNHNYGFVPHDLRHAYNHRGHQLGYNPKALADSLGHTMQMNSSGYLRHMSDETKLKGMMEAISKDAETRSRVEELETENKALKAQLEAANKEIELLNTKLKMYEAIQESKGQK